RRGERHAAEADPPQLAAGLGVEREQLTLAGAEHQITGGGEQSAVGPAPTPPWGGAGFPPPGARRPGRRPYPRVASPPAPARWRRASRPAGASRAARW